MNKTETQRVIAAVRSEGDLEAAMKSPARMVFLLQGDLCKLSEQCRVLREAGKQVFLHMDLVDGLKGDEAGMRYAAQEFHITGIISTKATSLKFAKEVGLLAIQRVFMLDTSALKTGVMHARNCKPDFVEVLPGISPQIIRLAVAEFPVPIIAGGLISSWEDVEGALAAGAAAVSSSRKDLWSQYPERKSK